MKTVSQRKVSAVHISSNAFNLPRQHRTFVSRDALMGDLSQSLQTTPFFEALEEKQDNPAKLQRQVILTGQGLGGVGKTQLALEYAHHPERYTKTPYQFRAWFLAETQETLQSSYQQLVEECGLRSAYASAHVIGAQNSVVHAGASINQSVHLHLTEALRPQQVRAMVKQYLSQYTRYLLVYDNATSYEELAEYLPDETQGADILITSRTTQGWPESFKTLPVSTMNPKEALSLLQQGSKRQDPEMPELAILLGYLPLALVQAAAYIKNARISTADYLRLYQDTDQLLKQNYLSSAEYSHAVAVTWNVSLQAVAASARARGEENLALPLLTVCSYLNPDSIPRVLLQDWVERSTSYSSIEAELKLTSTLMDLRKYSMIDWDETKKIESINVHRLVQTIIRYNHNKEMSASARISGEMLYCLSKAILQMLEKHNGFKSMTKVLLTHADSLITYFNEIDISFKFEVACFHKEVLDEVNINKAVKYFEEYYDSLEKDEKQRDRKDLLAEALLAKIECLQGLVSSEKHQKELIRNDLNQALDLAKEIDDGGLLKADILTNIIYEDLLAIAGRISHCSLRTFLSVIRDIFNIEKEIIKLKEVLNIYDKIDRRYNYVLTAYTLIFSYKFMEKGSFLMAYFHILIGGFIFISIFNYFYRTLFISPFFFSAGYFFRKMEIYKNQAELYALEGLKKDSIRLKDEYNFSVLKRLNSGKNSLNRILIFLANAELSRWIFIIKKSSATYEKIVGIYNVARMYTLLGNTQEAFFLLKESLQLLKEEEKLEHHSKDKKDQFNKDIQFIETHRKELESEAMPPISHFNCINSRTVLNGGAVALIGISLALGRYFKKDSVLEWTSIIITTFVAFICTCLGWWYGGPNQRVARDDAQNKNLKALDDKVRDLVREVKAYPLPSTQITAAQNSTVADGGKVEQKNITATTELSGGLSIVAAQGGTISGTVTQSDIHVNTHASSLVLPIGEAQQPEEQYLR